MAVDDVTTVISANLAADATADRQPSAGVEEMLLDIGIIDIEGSAPNGIPEARVLRIDGTNNQGLLEEANGGEGAGNYMRAKHTASNTFYFRFQNKGAIGDLTYSVIQLG